MYAVLPKMSKLAGMISTDSWKPYFACYRLAYLLALPAFICIGAGYGQIDGFGESVKTNDASGKPSVADLDPDEIGSHFNLRDAFVGTNLTKKLVRTLNLHDHGDPPTTSRYQEAPFLLAEDRADFKEQGLPLPTVPPDTRTQYIVAPVFKTWEKCVTRQRISMLCVENNPIVAFAIAQSDNMCAEAGMVACNKEELPLDPVYHCSSPSKRFKASEGPDGPYEGLCGRIIKPPDDAVIKQLKDVMRRDGWTDDRFPTKELWLDVRDEGCIGSPQECIDQWSVIGLIGIVFAVLTELCILSAMVLDCQTDRSIRRAKMYAQIKAQLPPQRPEFVKVHPQKGSNQTDVNSPQGQSLRSAATTSDRKGLAIQDGTLGSSSGGHQRKGMV
jgi:hypothetical protein